MKPAAGRLPKTAAPTSPGETGRRLSQRKTFAEKEAK